MKKFTLEFILLLVLFSISISILEINTTKAGGTIYIRVDGTIEGTNKIYCDGNVYTFTENIFDSIIVEKDNIVIDGAGYTLSGYYTGIDLSNRSNVTIKNLQITNFHCGIYLDVSSNNTIYHNNFINNTKQVSDFYYVILFGFPSLNLWDNDYPSGGNYWSDYAGQDADGDGIGDMPYFIYGKNQDNYPLMKPVIISELSNGENPVIPNAEPIPKWIIATLVIIAAFVAAFLVYFGKIKKTQSKITVLAF